MARKFSKEETAAWFIGLPSKKCGAALAVISKSDKKMLAVKASYRDYWTPPGGVVDDNESPLSAAVRECYEETGVVVDPDQVRLVSVIHVASSMQQSSSDTVQFLFAFETEEILDARPDYDEIEQVSWLSADEYENLCGSSQYHIAAARYLRYGSVPIFIDQSSQIA